MQHLPYELLQLIASNLLPKYQCRLALASKHNYKYLYGDLLRWHARKTPIPVPEYKIFVRYFTTYSMIISDNKVRLILASTQYIRVDNLTTLISRTIENNRRFSVSVILIRYLYWNEMFYKKILKITQCCKYVHKNYLITILNSKQPILKLTRSWKIRKHIRHNLNVQDLETINQCEHLSYIFME